MTAPKNNVEENKPDYSELPFRVLAEDTRAYTYGSQVKYYRNSWKEGFSTSNLIRATLSHVIAYYEYGEKHDKEALEAGHKVHHLSMARFNLACIIDGEIRGKGLDDRFTEGASDPNVAEDVKTIKFNCQHCRYENPDSSGLYSRSFESGTVCLCPVCRLETYL